MTRDPRYDILFDSIQLGPVKAKNRFYQAPHCNGMGRHFPTPLAAMRGMKAEGGWGVIFNEQCDIHYSGDAPRCVRLWDEQDLPLHNRVTDMVHDGGGLAGLMLTHNGSATPNIIFREVPISPSGRASYGIEPSHARAMDRSEIIALRRWYVRAAKLARQAGYDLIKIYAAHSLALPQHFISPLHNRRTDDYGGSMENRVRLLRELIEDVKDAVGHDCGVGVRFGVDLFKGPDGLTFDQELKDVVASMAEVPDWWDVIVGPWKNDSITSRFGPEGHQEPFVDFVKKITTKPVVGCGRFTSPDTMVSQIRRGVLDMIGAARPSIADPFLPLKIEEGRLEDIRECIGCNVCIINHENFAPSRCTQNPTFGEEWRRNWHPENYPAKTTDDEILIIGAGPAGLEAAHVLGKRGYHVLLADAAQELGGRVSRESRLPGLNAWARVRDYRLSQLNKLPNVEIFLDSRMDEEQVRETGCSLIAVATGCSWRRDGSGPSSFAPLVGFDQPHVYTPDDIMDGKQLSGSVVVYEDDHFYMASVMAERLVEQGCKVTIVTTSNTVADFTDLTNEHERILSRLAKLGVVSMVNHSIDRIGKDHLVLRDALRDETREIEASAAVLVAGRTPNDQLYRDLLKTVPAGRVHAIGECYAPGTIATAVYAGHRFGMDLTMQLKDDAPFLREDIKLHELA